MRLALLDLEFRMRLDAHAFRVRASEIGERCIGSGLDGMAF